MVSASRPPFTSEKFTNFARRRDIYLTTSSTSYSWSNGTGKRAVQVMKSLLAKSLRDVEDPFLSALTYNTTLKQDYSAPCELLMGGNLPIPIGRDDLESNY